MKLQTQIFNSVNGNTSTRKSTSPKKKTKHQKRNRKQQNNSTSPKQTKDYTFTARNSFQKQNPSSYAFENFEMQQTNMAHKLIDNMMVTKRGLQHNNKSVVNNSQTQYTHFPSRPIQSHPDDGFFSGAWLFDASQTPQWLKRELKTKIRNQLLQPSTVPAYSKQYTTSTFASTVKKTNRISLTEEEMIFETSGAWLFRLHDMPTWFQKEVKKRTTSSTNVILTSSQTTKNKNLSFNPMKKNLTSVFNNTKNEDGFYSGAWLFDLSCAPYWLQCCLSQTSTSSSSLYTSSLKKNVTSCNTAPIHEVNTKMEKEILGNGIESGAWLFDLTTAPTWFQLLLGKQTNQKPRKVIRRLSGFSYHTITQQKYNQFVALNSVPFPSMSSPYLNEELGFFSGAWLFDESMAPFWLKQALAPSKKSQVKNQVSTYSTHFIPQKSNLQSQVSDDDYYTGAWLFDQQRIPSWLKKEFKIQPSFHVESSSSKRAIRKHRRGN